MINSLEVDYEAPFKVFPFSYVVFSIKKRSEDLNTSYLGEINSPGEFRTSPKCNVMKGFERYFFTYNDPYPNITRTFLRFYNFV